MKISIALNGTEENPFHRLGLTQNPFPQIGSMATDPAERALNFLGAHPIPDTDHIRKVLANLVSEELIELCCSQFRKGEMVKFDITFPRSPEEERIGKRIERSLEQLGGR